MLTNNPGYVLSNEEDNDGRGNHEETVVEQQTILAQVFRVQLLLDNYSITGSEQIIQQDKRISEQKVINFHLMVAKREESLQKCMLRSLSLPEYHRYTN